MKIASVIAVVVMAVLAYYTGMFIIFFVQNFLWPAVQTIIKKINGNKSL